jgi:hypothetical protein
MRSLAILAALLMQDATETEKKLHPWASFPEGSRVTRVIVQEVGGKETSRDELTLARGPEQDGSIQLPITRGGQDGGAEAVLVKPAEDGLQDLKSVSDKKVKLKIGATTYDCRLEEMSASVRKGKWTYKIWTCEKVVVPYVVLQASASIPSKKLAEPVLKLEAFYDSGDGEPDYARYDVTSLTEKVKVGTRDVAAVKIRMERRMEKTRFETTEAVLSTEVPGHVVKWTTILKGGRGQDMKSTIAATALEVPAK